MKVRLETWVDIDIPVEDVEKMCQNLENAAWYLVTTYEKIHGRRQERPMVQCNEVVPPMPSRGNRQVYRDWVETQKRIKGD